MLSEIMAAVRKYAPDAVVFQESDGNVAIALNMRFNAQGILESFPDEVGDDFE